MADTNSRTGAPLTPAQVKSLKAFVAAKGEVEALAVLGITRVTLAKALAGMRIGRSTAALVTRGLR